MQYSVFGRIKRTIAGIQYKARLDTTSSDLSHLDAYVHANKDGTTVAVRGTLEGKTSTINTIQVQQFVPKGVLAVQYDLASRTPSASGTIGLWDTSVSIAGDPSTQSATITRQIGGVIVSSSVDTNRDTSIRVQRKAWSASWQPSCCSIGYAKWPLKATFDLPSKTKGAKLSVSRSLESFS